MKRSLYIAAPLACFAYFAPLQADAARCPSGTILYRSAGQCVSKAKAARAGIYRPRHVKASTRHRYKRPPIVKRATVRSPIVASSPAPAASPMHYSVNPERIAYGPFGELLPMPETVVSWALRNGVVQ